MKKFISKALIVSTVISMPMVSFAETDTNEKVLEVKNEVVKSRDILEKQDGNSDFDEYGMRNGLAHKKSMLRNGSWNYFPTKNNVELSKDWVITFSGEVTNDKIDGMVIEKDNEYIPVSVSLEWTNRARVTPVSSYKPNSTYTLKIFLNNGKRYKMTFNTEGEKIANQDLFTFDFNRGVITDYSKKGPRDVVIPKEIRGAVENKEVNGIGLDKNSYGAFYNQGITSVTIPKGVKYITDSYRLNYSYPGVFGYNKLTKLELPEGFETIGAHAFRNNQLTSLTLPYSIKIIKTKAFINNKLTQVVVPAHTVIENDAFDRDVQIIRR